MTTLRAALFAAALMAGSLVGAGLAAAGGLPPAPMLLPALSADTAFAFGATLRAGGPALLRAGLDDLALAGRDAAQRIRAALAPPSLSAAASR